MIYLACPYSHPEPEVREQRFALANRAAAKLIREGHTVFSPLSHSHPIAATGLIDRTIRAGTSRTWSSCGYALSFACSVSPAGGTPAACGPKSKSLTVWESPSSFCRRATPVDDRTCPHCREVKPLDEFPVNRTNGYRYRACKACRRQRDNLNQRDRYRNDPDYRRLKKSRSLAAYRKRTA